MSGPLDGVLVLDLTRFLSGPYCTLLLAGLGAEVIKIDDPASGDPTATAPPFAGPQGVSLQRKTDADFGLAYLKRARGKKSMTLDLKRPDGTPAGAMAAGFPLNFSRSEARHDAPAPMPGAHRGELLERLRESGVV